MPDEIEAKKKALEKIFSRMTSLRGSKIFSKKDTGEEDLMKSLLGGSTSEDQSGIDKDNQT